MKIQCTFRHCLYGIDHAIFWAEVISTTTWASRQWQRSQVPLQRRVRRIQPNVTGHTVWLWPIVSLFCAFHLSKKLAHNATSLLEFFGVLTPFWHPLQHKVTWRNWIWLQHTSGVQTLRTACDTWKKGRFLDSTNPQEALVLKCKVCWRLFSTSKMCSAVRVVPTTKTTQFYFGTSNDYHDDHDAMCFWELERVASVCTHSILEDMMKRIVTHPHTDDTHTSYYVCDTWLHDIPLRIYVTCTRKMGINQNLSLQCCWLICTRRGPNVQDREKLFCAAGYSTAARCTDSRQRKSFQVLLPTLDMCIICSHWLVILYLYYIIYMYMNRFF